MTYQHTPSPTIAEIVASLEYRGFLDFPARREHINLAKVQTQLNAVTEELGELARMLRRHDQGRADINLPELALEAADLVIAAVCLFGCAAGMDTDNVLTAKLRADEVEAFVGRTDDRGWLHSGLTREQYERTHGDRN
jgi:NTP pyrophosphatase (non-canonical NTP hydrolase)